MALPSLLITRPYDSAVAFVASLDPEVLTAVRVVIAPLMKIAPTGQPYDLEDHRAVIFTSANAVTHVPAGAGRIAYCVGEKTRQAALARGWRAQKAGDTAQELVAALQADPPNVSLLHLGGVHTRGDIAQRLTSSGLKTAHVAVYEQHLLPMAKTAVKALKVPCIIPVFSPRSAAHLVQIAKGDLGNAHVVALSSAVAAPFEGEKSAQLVVIPAPQAIYMRNAVENLCKSIGLP